MTMVPLEDFAPPARGDGVAYTSARIEQAAGPEGPWVVAATKPLTPTDTDPSKPALRTFVADLDLALWTRVVFVDGAVLESATDPLPPEGSTPGLRPSVSQIGALLRARTKKNMTGGQELGTFTAETRPTAAEVDEMIDVAVDEVTTKIGTPTAGSLLERRARRAVALYAALWVELSYWPEQVQSNRSPYEKYKELYDSLIKSLVADAEVGGDDDGGGGGDGGEGSPGNAFWGFPVDAGGLVGWQTRW